MTPGWLDTRGVAATLPWPDLAGKRCLDVATFNGFWGFEMERRGAAEVVGIDVLDPFRWDWPMGSDPRVVEVMAERLAEGRGFDIAKAALGSAVNRIERSVYELDPEVDGTFDFVYVGSLLVHLRDPVRALERICGVCAGSLLVVDGIDVALSLLLRRLPVARLDGRGRPWWWYWNAAGLARAIESGGFEVTDGPRRIYIPSGPGGQPHRPLGWRGLVDPETRQRMIVSRKGDPHAVIVARPRTPPV